MTDPPLKAGVVFLIGVTDDKQVVYTVKGATATARNIEAVAITGGAPATVGTVDADEDVAIAGNAIGFWNDVSQTTGAGKLSLWTKAGGVKANVATDSIPGLISASSDGSKIAFSFNSPAETTDLAITTPGAPATVANATTGIITAVNVVSETCQPRSGFSGNVFFSLHCTGPGDTLTDASLVVLPAAASPVPTTLVDGTASAAAALKPGFFSPDKAGTKVLVAGGPNSQGRVVTVAGAGIVNLENNVATGFLTDDGLAAVYRTTGNALKRVPTAGGTATTLVATDVRTILGVSPTKSHVVFNVAAPVSAGNNVPKFDIKLADTTTAAQTPGVVLAASTGFPGTFTATGSHYLYLSDIVAAQIPVGKLHSRLIGGAGTDRDVSPATGLPDVAATGTKGVYFDNPKQVGQDFVVDLKVFDAASTAAATTAATAAEEFYVISGTKLVFTRPGPTGGVYAVDMP